MKLKVRTDLENKRGEVIKDVDHCGRWEVRLEDGYVVNARAANLARDGEVGEATMVETDEEEEQEKPMQQLRWSDDNSNADDDLMGAVELVWDANGIRAIRDENSCMPHGTTSLPLAQVENSC